MLLAPLTLGQKVPGYLPEHRIAVAFQMNTDDGRAAGRPLYRWLAELAGIARRELAR